MRGGGDWGLDDWSLSYCIYDECSRTIATEVCYYNNITTAYIEGGGEAVGLKRNCL